jgi:hypothetical protein
MPTDRRARAFAFAALYPERAHGLNRFGFIQENIHERNHQCAKADYFGLITASGEESGKTFQLRADKRHDEKTGRELQKAEVTANAATVTQLDGAITNVETKEVTTFRLWFDSASDDLLPLRFEFRPKSYLKLVFTAAH